MVPHIIHIKTHIRIKLLTLILQDGLANSKGSLLEYSKHVNSGSKRKDLYCKAINNILNTKILRNSNNK